MIFTLLSGQKKIQWIIFCDTRKYKIQILLSASSFPGIQPPSFVYILSVAAFTELNRCDRDCMASKEQNICYQGLQQKFAEPHPFPNLLASFLVLSERNPKNSLGPKVPACLSDSSPLTIITPHSCCLWSSLPYHLLYMLSLPSSGSWTALSLSGMLFWPLHDWLLFLWVSAQEPRLPKGLPYPHWSISLVHLIPAYFFPGTFVYLFIFLSPPPPPGHKLHRSRAHSRCSMIIC